MSGSADTSKPVETYGRGLYVGVLVFVSLLSVAGNAVYAYAAPAVSEASLSPGWAAAAHMIPPVTLLLVTEVLAMASTKFSGKGRAWALAGVVVIAAAAFALSFDALYEVALMAKVRAELAWLVPVMLDVAIIVCTTLVLMASRQMQRDRAEAPPAVVDLSTPASEPVEMPRPTERSTNQLVRSTSPVDQMVELVDRALDESTDRPVDQFAAERSTALVEPVELNSSGQVDSGRPSNSTGPDQVVHADEQAPTDRSTTTDEQSDEPVEFGPSDRSTATGQVVDHAPDELVDRALGQRSTEPADHPVESVEQIPTDRSTESTEQVVRMPGEQSSNPTEWVALAERVKSSTSITADTDDLATVLRMDAAGATRAEIAGEVGRAKSTVSGWIRITNSVSRPQSELVAVD